MSRREIFEAIRLSAKELFLLWKGGLIFLVLCVAGVLGGFANSWTVFFSILLLSMFYGVLWFFPFVKNNWVIKGFVGIVFLYILANVILGDNLLNAITRSSTAIKNHSASTLNGKTDTLRTRTLLPETPLYTKSGLGNFGEILYDSLLKQQLVVKVLEKEFEHQKMMYSLVLFPRKDSSDNYMSGTFDSTSKSWWVPVENLKKIETTAEIKAHQAAELKAAGWQFCMLNETADTGIVELFYPENVSAGDSIVFRSPVAWKEIWKNGKKTATCKKSVCKSIRITSTNSGKISVRLLLPDTKTPRQVAVLVKKPKTNG